MKKAYLALVLVCAFGAFVFGCDNTDPPDGCELTNGGIEACGDYIDNDCDGQVDEGCTSTGDCSDGEQRGCGGSPEAMVCRETCSGGRWGVCVPQTSGGEICGNSLDDDCDGTADEGCECGAGDIQYCGGTPDARICARECRDGRFTDCAPTSGNDGREICNDLDDDCNGSIDDAAGGCSCTEDDEQWCGGTPEEHSCRQVCTGGTWSECAPTSGREEEERCGDAEDNDCDGDIDEPLPCTSPCGDGLQRCEGSTRGECEVEGADCAPDEEQHETCTAAAATDCREGSRTRTCSARCEWGAWGDCTDLVGPSPSTSIDDCYDSYHLGTDPDVTFHLYMPASATSQWFSLNAVDNTSLFSNETIEVDATDLPGDFALNLYFSGCSSSAIVEQDVDGRADEHLSWEEERCSDGCDDDGTYYVEVYNWFGSEGCYTLHINGLN